MARGGAERTYSIWGLLALFTVLATVGILMFIGGSPQTPTEQVSGPATPNSVLGGPASDEAALSAGTAATDSVDGAGATSTSTPASTAPGTAAPTTVDPNAPVTVPGGAPAPDGVREVLRSDGATSFTFDVAEEFPAASATTAVAPVRATAAADGRSLDISVGCAGSAQETLAQLSVSETPAAVTVVAVVLVPAGGAPCDPAAAPRVVNFPLTEPLGSRSVVVVPAGTPIPPLTPG